MINNDLNYSDISVQQLSIVDIDAVKGYLNIIICVLEQIGIECNLDFKISVKEKKND